VRTEDCEFVCSHTDQFFWLLILGAVPLILSLFISVVLIVAVIRKGVNLARANGQQLESGNRWSDAGLATVLTLAAMLGSGAAIGSYVFVGRF
jgi:hypothetical protein